MEREGQHDEAGYRDAQEYELAHGQVADHGMARDYDVAAPNQRGQHAAGEAKEALVPRRHPGAGGFSIVILHQIVRKRLLFQEDGINQPLTLGSYGRALMSINRK
jgi:hypothetical protein